MGNLIRIGPPFPPSTGIIVSKMPLNIKRWNKMKIDAYSFKFALIYLLNLLFLLFIIYICVNMCYLLNYVVNF